MQILFFSFKFFHNLILVGSTKRENQRNSKIVGFPYSFTENQLVTNTFFRKFFYIWFCPKCPNNQFLGTILVLQLNFQGKNHFSLSCSGEGKFPVLLCGPHVRARESARLSCSHRCPSPEHCLWQHTRQSCVQQDALSIGFEVDGKSTLMLQRFIRCCLVVDENTDGHFSF